MEITIVTSHYTRANFSYMRQWTQQALVQVMAARRQAITWSNAGLLSIGPLGTHFSEIVIKNSNFFMKENAFENVVCQNGGHLVHGR